MRNLKALRKLAGISAQELADKTGLSKQSIHAYERGSNDATTHNASKIAEALGVSLNELVGASFQDKLYDQLEKK